MKANKNLWVLVLICIINSLGFGIIVPLLYSYGKQYGLTGVSLGWLTASFSIAQFFATPLLGAMSDRLGRKPLLVISLAGTCLSFILFAEARSLILLFAARILDGLTGGNISVAQAMVSDSSTPKDRAKNFGIIGSAFGFGFVIGPAIGGLLSNYGMKVPFYFAAGVSLVGVLCSLFFLKETNGNKKEAKAAKERYAAIFMSLATILRKPVVGTAIFTGFLLTMAQFTMIIGFQTFSVDIAKISPTTMGIFFAVFGIAGIIAQLCVPMITKQYQKPFILLISTILCFVAMLATGFTVQFLPFAIGLIFYSLFNGLRNPMLNAIIAEHNDPKQQGRILGINQSYVSIGQTLGPVTAGLAVAISIHAVFFLSALYILVALLFVTRLSRKIKN